MDLPERFWANVDKDGPNGCWIWTGHANSTGYGRLSIHGTQSYAHRLLYESAIGPLPPGARVEHSCGQKLCMNPSHLGLMDLEDRFWVRVDKAGDCWTWTGTTIWNGYGRITWKGRSTLVHRIAYELLVGPVPGGLTIDHLCRNRLCCNPAHMEPVTDRENVRRGMSPMAINARKTHCKHGHEFTLENTMRVPTRPNARHCRACARARQLRAAEDAAEAERKRERDAFLWGAR